MIVDGRGIEHVTQTGIDVPGDDKSTDDTAVGSIAEQFHIIPNGTSRGKDLLVSNLGYSYNTCKHTKIGRIWVCTIRRKSHHCRARVIQRGDNFETRSQHNHLGEPGLLDKAKLTAKVCLTCSMEY